jgi:diguanylate cyclase
MAAAPSKSASAALRRREYGLRFVSRMYPPRIVGLALGGVAIATVLWANGAQPVVWLALGLSALVWPHIAYGLGVGSRNPYQTELRNLTVDSALGGAFIALMKFNVLPSVLLVVMLSMDKLAVGGGKLLARCTVALAGTCTLVAWATGFQVQLDTTMAQVYGSLPLLVVYPLAVGVITYNMARRMRYQSQQLAAMSTSDALSRTMTRQAWERVVAEEFAVSQRAGLRASVVLIDIDALQEVNEHHGYSTGDEVIRSVAALLRNSLREEDFPCRYGGEEFAVLMPGADGARAEEIAEAARKAVSAAVLERSARLRGTISAGVAQLEATHTDYRAWISNADEALRIAKEKGGNRTVRYRPLNLVPPPSAPSAPGGAG